MLRKLSFLILILFVTSALPVLAQTTTASPTAQQTTKDQFKNLNQDRKDAVKDLKTSFKSARDEFKNKILQIRDEKKKLIVARIDDHIATANAKLTGKMTNAISRMSAILTDLKTKSAALKTAGKDTGALDAAITLAEAAISNAQTQVSTQSQKTYTANITTDGALRFAIGQMYSQFRLDISSTHKAVTNAKQALMKALSELAKLGGTGDTNASQSAATNNQL